MSKPMLYHNPASSPSWAVRMLAARIGLALDTTEVNLFAFEHKDPKYLQINPMGTVPTIVDGDFNISESHTIGMYLLKKYGQQHLEQLYPSDIKARARVDQAMYFDTGVAFIRLKRIALPVFFEGQDTIDDKVLLEIEDVYRVTEMYLNKAKYIAADHLTLADITLGSTILSLEEFHPINGFPRVKQWLGELKEDKYFKEIAIPGKEILGTAVRSSMEKNRMNKQK